MLDSFGEWGHSIPNSSLDVTVDYILTGKNIDTADGDTLLIKHINNLVKDPHNPTNILDFGCGVGRNAIPIATKFQKWNISCYDNSNMLTQMKNFCYKKYNTTLDSIENIKCFSDWNILKTHKFDIIYATLVMQHINPNSLMMYLKDIKNMTKYLIVFGRRYNDYSYNDTWSIIDKSGMIPHKGWINPINGDPHEHSWCIYNMEDLTIL